MSDKTKADDTPADIATARAESAKAAQARIKAIMSSDAAKAAPDQAEHLAYDTDLPADAALAILGKAPKASVPDPQDEPADDADEAYADGRAKASRLARPAAKASSTTAAKAGWSKAVSRINARI